MHHDRRRAESFGDDAEQYDRARPGYPDALIDDLVDGVTRPDPTVPITVLDVGCGTGKVGRLFAARGCTVLRVEPDPRMATVAQRHGLEVEIATHSILLGNVTDTRFVETADSFRRAAAFDDPQIATYTWVRRYSTAEWLDVLATHSDHRTLPADRLAMLSTAVEQVLVDFGGSADVTYDTVVVTARAAH